MEYVVCRWAPWCHTGSGLSREQRLKGWAFVFGKILRPTSERILDIAPNIFAMGNLTEDSLIRALKLRLFKLRLCGA